MVHDTWHRLGALAGLLLVTTLILLPVFDNGFVYDDTDVIENGKVIHDVANLPDVFRRPAMFVSAKGKSSMAFDTYRPMTLVSFFWDSAISGRDPFAYHLTNLLMHLFCVILVFLLAQSLLGREAWLFALFGTAWFALSPHPSTAHIWINGRSDLFCTAYGLAAILTWHRALAVSTQPMRAASHLVAGLLFFAGLLSKETLLMVIPALWLWPESSTSVRMQERILRTGPFLAASAAYLALRLAVFGGGLRASGGSDHLRAAIRFLAPLELEGLLGALWPRRLYLRFLNDEMASLSGVELALLAVLFLATLGALWALRRRAGVFAWGLLWFGLCLAPAALIAGILWPGFGRYLYLSSAGLAVSMGWLARYAWERLPKWRAAHLVAAFVYLTVHGTSLRGWAQDFRDVDTLYGATITRNPEGPHAYGWLGIAHRKRGEAEASIGPLTLARQLAPREPRYTHHLLYALIETGRSDIALDLARQCVRLHPSDAAECQLLLYATSQGTDPELAFGYLVDCMRNDRKPARCSEAFEHALSKHPLRERYRQLAEDRSTAQEMSDVRAQ